MTRALATFLALVCVVMSCERGGQKSEAPPTDISQISPVPGLEPALTQTVDDDDVLATLVGSERQCGRCHAEIVREWSGSTHAHASRTNPFYRQAFMRFIDEAGPVPARLCAGCHEPALLFTGDLTEPAPDAEATRAAIGCMACHGIIDADAVGNAAYTWSGAPVPVPVERDYRTLGAHMDRTGRPALRSEALCASCHRAVIEGLPGLEGHLVGVDEFTAWRDSVYREGGVDGLGEKVAAQGCVSCHMPFNGKYRDHRFAGGNTTLAAALGDEAQLRAVEVNARGSVELHILPVADDSRAINIVLFNTRVGHNYPGGVLDLRDVWLEVEARRGTDRQTVVSGPGPGLVRFELGARALDADGKRLGRHEVARFRSVEARVVAPRGAISVRFRMPQSWSSATLDEVRGRLMQRRLTRSFQKDVCDARQPDETIDPCRQQPILEVASSRWTPGTTVSARSRAVRDLAGSSAAVVPLRQGSIEVVPTADRAAPSPTPDDLESTANATLRAALPSDAPDEPVADTHTIRAAYGNDLPSLPRSSGASLDQLLAMAPSAQAWEEIMARLVAIESPVERSRATERVEAATAQWPHAVRRLPPAWLGHLDTLPVDVLALTRSIQWRFDAPTSGRLKAVLAHGAFGHVTRLDLHGLRTVDLISTVANSPLAARLEFLSLGGCGLGDDDASALAEVKTLTGLRELFLSDNDIGPRGVDALVAASFLPTIEHLDLRRNRLGSKGARILAGTDRAAHLSTLNLGWNALGDEGAQALANASGLPAVTHLDLGSNDIGPAGAQALAAGSFVHGLRRLSLWRNLIGDRGAAALFASKSVKNLYELDISLAGITPAGLEPVRDHPLPALKALYAYGNAFGPRGCATLAGARGLSALEHLEIGNNAIGDRGLGAFADHELASLRELVVWRNAITDQGVTTLAASGALGRLDHVNLFDNEVGTGGIDALLEPSGGGSVTVELSRNHLGLWIGRTLGAAHAAEPWPKISPWDERAHQAIARRLSGGRWVSFRDNPLGDDGVAALVEHARTETITHLSLDQQRLTGKGLRTIAGVAKGWPRLVHLELRGNRLREDGLAQTLATLIEAAPTLDTIDLSLNPLSAAAKKRVEAGLQPGGPRILW